MRLSDELEKRRKVATMLRDFAQAQKDLAKQAETRLEVTLILELVGLKFDNKKTLLSYYNLGVSSQS